MIIGGNRLPDSCARVLKVLTGCGKGVSQQRLIAETGLSERAVKYAIKGLVQEKLAFYKIVLDDTRRRLYYAEVGK
ncbi:hypothetical protein HYU16_04910 [Candidatus Woesearchaeota archaeon]|nr:hypothetical protein [Candidatus Woesearchaeota archaeon]